MIILVTASREERSAVNFQYSWTVPRSQRSTHWHHFSQEKNVFSSLLEVCTIYESLSLVVNYANYVNLSFSTQIL